MREPAMRAQLLSEEPSVPDKVDTCLVPGLRQDYSRSAIRPTTSPTRESSVRRAPAMGVSPAE